MNEKTIRNKGNTKFLMTPFEIELKPLNDRLKREDGFNTSYRYFKPEISCFNPGNSGFTPYNLRRSWLILYLES